VQEREEMIDMGMGQKDDQRKISLLAALGNDRSEMIRLLGESPGID